jgi:hypothetical protein
MLSWFIIIIIGFLLGSNYLSTDFFHVQFGLRNLELRMVATFFIFFTFKQYFVLNL